MRRIRCPGRECWTFSHTAGVTSTILHIVARPVWDQIATDPNGQYVDASLEAEGFIHCSTPNQVLIPANERFHGQDDLVLLIVDIDKVPARTVFEDCYESGLAFPHIYGPIPVAAVDAVVPFPCGPDGSFTLPAELA